MRNILLTSAAVAVLLAGGCTPTRAKYLGDYHEWTAYGTWPDTWKYIDPEVTPAEIVAHPEWCNGETRVVLEGTVSDVCRTMGCWLEIEGKDGTRILVMNRDHGFFIPRNATGRRVFAVGWPRFEEHSVEMAKHLAMDAGKPQAEIDAITEPTRKLVFVADGVLLPTGGLEAPVKPLPAEQAVPPADQGMTPAPAEAAK